MGWLGRVKFKEFRNRALCGATAAAVKLLFASVRFRAHDWEPVKLLACHGQGVIFALWHNTLMLPLGHESCRGTMALVSPGRDGEFATRVIAHFGVGAVRGSSSRQSTAALHHILHAVGPGRTFSITPDGPRGPRYRFQPGAAWLAARSGLPVVPLGIALTRAWKLRSWDRFRIPKPFSHMHLVFGKPIYVSRELDAPALEAARARLESALGDASRAASHLAGCAWPD